MFVNESYNLGELVTPSDTVDFANYARYGCCDAIYCASSSNITVVWENGATTLFTTVPAGILEVKIKRINASATGTGPFVALWRI